MWRGFRRFGRIMGAGAALILVCQMGTALSRSCLDTSPLDCQGQSIANQDLSQRSLAGANFTGATLKNVEFTRAGLLVSMFNQASLSHVTFADANLRGASFSGARFEEVIFAGADLSGARFDEAMIDAAELESAITCNTTMPDERTNNSDCGR